MSIKAAVVGAALLAYANMIVFNVGTGFRSLAVASAKSYALPEEDVALSTFPDRLQALVNELLRMLTGTLQLDLNADALTLLVIIWFAAALLITVKHTRGLFVLTALSTALVIGYSNKVYGAGYAERYIMFLVPLAFAAMGVAADIGWQTLRSRSSRAVSFAVAGVGAAVLVFVLAQSLANLNSHYAVELGAGRSNASYFEWDEIARPYVRDGYQVVIGKRLDRESVVPLGSTYGVALGYLLNLQSIATTTSSADELRTQMQDEPQTKRLLLLERTGEFARLRTQFPLCVVSGLPGRVMATYTGAPCR
ncbi:MAG: hypothetical protein LC737_11535 [Chloroflexi bacterium]|nr:hypothetical protein [Chloroflexota bacterium]